MQQGQKSNSNKKIVLNLLTQLVKNVSKIKKIYNFQLSHF
jgi:hypothetical protein